MNFNNETRIVQQIPYDSYNLKKEKFVSSDRYARPSKILMRNNMKFNMSDSHPGVSGKSETNRQMMRDRQMSRRDRDRWRQRVASVSTESEVRSEVRSQSGARDFPEFNCELGDGQQPCETPPKLINQSIRRFLKPKPKGLNDEQIK